MKSNQLSQLPIILISCLFLAGCWQRVAIARGVKKVESGDGPVGQVIHELGEDDQTNDSGVQATGN